MVGHAFLIGAHTFQTLCSGLHIELFKPIAYGSKSMLRRDCHIHRTDRREPTRPSFDGTSQASQTWQRARTQWQWRDNSSSTYLALWWGRWSRMSFRSNVRQKPKHPIAKHTDEKRGISLPSQTSRWKAACPWDACALQGYSCANASLWLELVRLREQNDVHFWTVGQTMRYISKRYI